MASAKYERPPLMEARCEVVLTGGEWNDDTSFHIRAHLSEGFPTQVNTPAGETKARVIMSRADDQQVVQFFPDRVVVSQLRPYPGFQVWKQVVLDMVELHQEVIGSRKIERVGLRYVNRIALPDRHADVSRYLKVEANRTDGFRRKVSLKPRHEGHRLIATVGTSHASGESRAVALLDLYDYVDAGDCGDVGNVSVCLDEAHENVEASFEKMVTPTAKESFGELRT